MHASAVAGYQAVLLSQERKRKRGSEGRMYAAKDDSAAAAFSQGRSLTGLQEVPLGQRAVSTSGREQAATAR